MIEQLSVRDYILFDSANINFKNGMSVITGETGAGKSVSYTHLTLPTTPYV